MDFQNNDDKTKKTIKNKREIYMIDKLDCLENPSKYFSSDHHSSSDHHLSDKKTTDKKTTDKKNRKSHNSYHRTHKHSQSGSHHSKNNHSKNHHSKNHHSKNHHSKNQPEKIKSYHTLVCNVINNHTIQTNYIDGKEAVFDSLKIKGRTVEPPLKTQIVKYPISCLSFMPNYSPKNQNRHDKRSFYTTNTDITESLDNIVYRDGKKPPSGNLVFYVSLKDHNSNIADSSNECKTQIPNINEILFNPAFKNDYSVPLSVKSHFIILKCQKYEHNLIRYGNCEILDINYDNLPPLTEVTLKMLWKGSLPNNFLEELHDDVYLMIIVDIPQLHTSMVGSTNTKLTNTKSTNIKSTNTKSTNAKLTNTKLTNTILPNKRTALNKVHIINTGIPEITLILNSIHN